MRRVWVGLLCVLVIIGGLPWTASAEGSYPAGGWGGVYDRGPTVHAQGYVHGNTYVVVQGDTLYSVSRRFGLTVQQMAAANGICNPWWIYPGQRLIIAGGYVPHPPPKPYPPPNPIPPPPPPPPSGPPYITIIEPVPGSVLPLAFIVRGMGGALPGGQVVVRARDAGGALLAEGITPLTGPDVLAGGEGPWSIELAVSVPVDTAGTLEAGTPTGAAVTVQPAIVPVTFAGSGGGSDAGSGAGSGSQYVVYPAGQCQVTLVAVAPLYAFPGGPLVGQADVIGPFDALRGALVNDRLWYEYAPLPGQPSAWVVDVAAVSAGCGW